ncbi:hypothetical protein AD945_06320 [Gluconobacter albidus]|uniref:Uncharacterized protein n=1 Tax=Gluconobacter albidus TaxID=318683 RepID=A0A149TK32_9PROT|nr:hypothetical protein AD945_06320 [Gluconobacter albidus]
MCDQSISLDCTNSFQNSNTARFIFQLNVIKLSRLTFQPQIRQISNTENDTGMSLEIPCKTNIGVCHFYTMKINQGKTIALMTQNRFNSIKKGGLKSLNAISFQEQFLFSGGFFFV